MPCLGVLRSLDLLRLASETYRHRSAYSSNTTNSILFLYQQCAGRDQSKQKSVGQEQLV